VRFSTYAMYWIRSAIWHGQETRLIRLPQHIEQQQRALERARDAWLATQGCEPTDQELAASLHRDVTFVQRMHALWATPLSLDEADEDGHTLLHDIPDPVAEACFDDVEEQETLHAQLACLTAQERTVIRLAFGLSGGPPSTYARIGEQLHLSSERVRQIRGTALAKLRQVLKQRSEP
jgi:RNA polymerase primary sigma factor